MIDEPKDLLEHWLGGTIFVSREAAENNCSGGCAGGLVCLHGSLRNRESEPRLWAALLR